jgi:hypothetical protein
MFVYCECCVFSGRGLCDGLITHPEESYRLWYFFVCDLETSGGRDSSVGIATCYGLDGPGVKSRWERDFSRLSRPALGSTQPPKQRIPCFSPEVKRPGRGVDHPSHLASRLNEE